ncbi:MAG: hypothetical protein PHE50_05965, partial [Dehalococcoidales bacterium]|nr:hypothetical protein [Dehalococcoidales bacterium]
MTNKNILILNISQNKDVVMTKTLIREGYQVSSVNSLAAAVKNTNLSACDLVITRADEPELLNLQLGQFPPEIGVLLICPKESIEKAIECAGIGIRSFLVEPYSAAKFKETVRQAINKNQMIAEGLRNKVLVTLEQANHLYANELEASKIFDVVVEMSFSVTQSDLVSIMIKDEDSGVFELKAVRGEISPALERISREAMVNGAQIIVDETTDGYVA